MEIGIIAAISENNVIGYKDKLPWRIPEDLARFRRLTIGHPVIMGRKTYESIGGPLEKRYNIVLSRGGFDEAGIDVRDSLEGAISFLREEGSQLEDIDCSRVYVMGGASVYEKALPIATFMEITKVHKEVEGDTYFPEVDWREWQEMDKEIGIDYSFISYKRRLAEGK